MREIQASQVTEAVKRMCIKGNVDLPCDVASCIEKRMAEEDWRPAKEILERMVENYRLAAETGKPICQDTGMAVVFLEIGQDVSLVGGYVEDAVNEGVARGYRDGYLRKSVVADPLERVNTGDNTPAVIHTRIVPGDRVKITLAPKGFGSENMSRMKMFTPAATEEDIISFVTETVKLAGSNPCPPVVLGVGIGGDFELCAYLAKKALCREVSERNPDPYYAELESKLLAAVNGTGVGPQGFGGDTTALAVNIETYPTHIAGLPVSVNVGCHVTRHKTFTI